MEEMEKEIIYLRNQINMLKICLVITQVSAIIVLVSLLYQYSRLAGSRNRWRLEDAKKKWRNKLGEK